MKIRKLLIYGNIVAFSLNGLIVGLMGLRAFPPILGVILILLFLVASVWFSCLVNGKLPQRKQRQRSFYTTPTEKVARL